MSGGKLFHAVGPTTQMPGCRDATALERGTRSPFSKGCRAKGGAGENSCNRHRTEDRNIILSYKHVTGGRLFSQFVIRCNSLSVQRQSILNSRPVQAYINGAVYNASDGWRERRALVICDVFYCAAAAAATARSCLLFISFWPLASHNAITICVVRRRAARRKAAFFD